MFDFKDHTKEEKAEIERKKRDIEVDTANAAEALRLCLTSDTFKKYRKELDIANNNLIELGIDILKRVKDSKERVFLYDALFVRADVLGLLLKQVNTEKEKHG